MAAGQAIPGTRWVQKDTVIQPLPLQAAGVAMHAPRIVRLIETSREYGLGRVARRDSLRAGARAASADTDGGQRRTINGVAIKAGDEIHVAARADGTERAKHDHVQFNGANGAKSAGQ